MGSVTAVTLEAPAARWPSVVGVAGIVLAALTLLDKAADLLVLLLWPRAEWGRLLPPQEADLLVRVVPPASYLAISALVWMALAGLLLAGSERLRRRRRSGADLCRRWSWWAIAWFGIEMALGLGWLGAHAHEISAVAPAGWQVPAILGILLGIVLMLAYPLFLLVWLARPAVREELAAWEA